MGHKKDGNTYLSFLCPTIHKNDEIYISVHYADIVRENNVSAVFLPGF